MRTISRFHYATVFIDGVAFTSAEQLHNELALKLGLPQWYGRTFDALLDCLSSIDDLHGNLCTHWELHPGKRMVLQVKGLPDDTEYAALLKIFAQTVSAANERLSQGESEVNLWVEFA
jgi:hypothetical protein